MLYRTYRHEIHFYLNRERVNYDVTNKIDDRLSEFGTISISQQELNDMIDAKVEGKGIGDDVLVSAEAEILPGKVLIKGLLQDGTTLKAEIGVSENGTDIVVKDLELSESGILSSVKETLIKTFLKASIESVVKQGSESGYAKTDIRTGEIVIYINARPGQ